MGEKKVASYLVLSGDRQIISAHVPVDIRKFESDYLLTDKSVCCIIMPMSKKTSSNPKERIIETALNLFYKQGYLATGINQIIAESQVAKATFYSHFSTKEALCVAYLQARHIIWMGWLKESVENSNSSKEKLIGVFSFLRKWMQESDYRGCAFLNIASEVPTVGTKIRYEVVKHKDDLQRYLRTIIEDLINSNISSADLDVKKTAKMVYVLVEGAIVSSQNYSETWPIDSAEEAVAKLLNL